MKRFLPLLVLLVLAAGSALGATGGTILVPNTVPPVNSAISPVDINTGTSGYQGYLYQADINGSPGVSPRVIIYSTNQSSYPLAKTATIGPSSLAGTPRGLAVSPDGQQLWVALENTSAVKVYSKTGTAVGTVTGASFGGPKQIAFAPDGKYVYVVDSVNYKVYVINATTRAVALNESISEAGLFGLAVSPDNTMLAVGVNASSGKVKIYNIVRNASGAVTDLTLKTTITEGSTGNLAYPTYLAFDNASERLFVRVRKSTATCVDALVYNTTSFSSPMTIVLEDASGSDLGSDDSDFGNSLGEALTLSDNGKYLYLTHYVDSAAKVFVYRMPTFIPATGAKRSSWEFSTSSSVGDSIVRDNLAPSKDSIAFQPDGARIWFTFREDGNDPIYTRYTGFTDGSGNLANKIPGAPDIIHPEAPDTMDAYSGNAEWAAGVDDSPSSGYRYEVCYRDTDDAAWTVLEGYTANLTASLASLTKNEWYLLRVRMFDGANWSACTYSEPFRKAGATISGIEIDTDRRPTYQTWSAYNSSSNIGYIYDAIRINGSGFGTVSNPWTNGDTTTNRIILHYGTTDYVVPGYVDANGNSAYDAGEETISSWTDNQINLVIPRKFKDASLLMPREYTVSVRSAGVTGENTYNFKIGPVVTVMSPVSGSNGTTVDIYGAGFGATQGTSTIKFYNNVTATATVWESTTTGDHIRCTVPTGAADGRVTATVNSILTSINYAGNAMGSYNLPVTFDVTAGVNPTITGFQLDTDPSPSVSTWVDTTTANVYDHIKIVGNNFGTDPGDGNRDTATNRVTLAGNVIRDDTGSDGLQVYAWSNTAIEIGIPRRVSSTLINAGANAVIVRALGLDSASSNLNIKPKLYSITPSGYQGSLVTLEGTALDGTRTVYFGTTNAGAGTIVRENGDDPDGTNGNDKVSVVVPMATPVGATTAYAQVNSQNSNSLPFTVLQAGAPNILQVIPDCAPNTADITVAIYGTNFQSGATAVLKRTAETDIVGTVTYVSSTQLSVVLPISTRTPGKWDVVVTNPDLQTATLSKGFTITDGSGEIANIIDDFEGVAVVYPTGYASFPAPDSLTLTISTSDLYEGAQAGSVTYPISTGGYRGYNGHCAIMQDITDFTTIIVALKGDSGAGTAKVQIQDIAGHTFGAPSSAINLSGATWAKTSIPLTNFVEIDSLGNPVVGGATLDKAHITDYQVVFTGNAASLANIGVDFVAAGGYVPPTSETGPITTIISRVADTVGSGVTMSWVYNDSYTGNADIYAVSGAWDSTTNVFTTDPVAWGAPIATNVASPYTDTSTSGQVGAGTQKYYKVVQTGVPLTVALLQVDVAAKYDIGLTAGQNLLSVPIVPTSNALGALIGTQLQAGAVPPLSDKINKFKADKSGYEQVWLNSLDNQWYDADTMAVSIMEIGPDTGFWVELAEGHSSASMTIVGKVADTSRSIGVSAGFNFLSSSYPVRVALGSTNLRESGASAGLVPPLAAKVYSFKDDKSGFNQYWLNSADNLWYDAETMTITDVQLAPSKGYIVEEVEGITPYTWNYTKPY